MDSNQLHPGNPINDPNGNAPRTRSKFAFNRRLYQTARFGELTPCLVMEGNPSETLPLHSSHMVRSYTLKAPLLNDIQLKKDYFSVPRTCLLPINFDKIYVNPTIGDDIDPEQVGTSVNINVLLSVLVNDYLKDFLGTNVDPETDLSDYVTHFVRWLLMSEAVFSSGSLVRNLGQDLSRCFAVNDVAWVRADNPFIVSGQPAPHPRNLFDYIAGHLFDLLKPVLNGAKVSFAGDLTRFTIDTSAELSYNGYNDGPMVLCWHDLLMRCRDSLNFTFFFEPAPDVTSLSACVSWLINNASVIEFPERFDLARLFAYQIVCRHFYSNDHIDYIYSADLYRQLIWSYLANFITDQEFTSSFVYNGVNTQYDYLSAHYFEGVFGLFAGDVTRFSDSSYSSIFDYFSAIFNFQRSLRFVDYFTGAKSQPLAVGDSSYAVDAGRVNVIDSVRGIQKTRFLNWVQRTGRRAKEYIKSLFGGNVNFEDYHDPKWIAHTADTIYAVENENTSTDQFDLASSVTSVLRSSNNADRYTFEYEVMNYPCICIGIMYFDISRCYCNSNDRQTFDVDRYDMFNPFMQFVGDQDVKLAELGIPAEGSFAYQLRDMQYKQSYDIACGGFVDNLPGWAFTTGTFEMSTVDHIKPDFIRSRNSELDRFYLILSGSSLANYFHFIIINTNKVDASRPMAYSPNIL